MTTTNDNTAIAYSATATVAEVSISEAEEEAEEYLTERRCSSEPLIETSRAAKLVQEEFEFAEHHHWFGEVNIGALGGQPSIVVECNCDLCACLDSDVSDISDRSWGGSPSGYSSELPTGELDDDDGEYVEDGVNASSVSACSECLTQEPDGGSEVIESREQVQSRGCSTSHLKSRRQLPTREPDDKDVYVDAVWDGSSVCSECLTQEPDEESYAHEVTVSEKQAQSNCGCSCPLARRAEVKERAKAGVEEPKEVSLEDRRLEVRKSRRLTDTSSPRDSMELDRILCGSSSSARETHISGSNP